MTNWIETAIQEAGYKITVPRSTIATWIETHDGIFSVKDILQEHTQLDKVSVYRTIELLLSLDIIRNAINRDDQQYYEVHNHDNHHHHVVCTGCKTDACVPCTMPDQLPRVKGFSDVHHDLSFTGLCSACR